VSIAFTFNLFRPSGLIFISKRTVEFTVSEGHLFAQVCAAVDYADCPRPGRKIRKACKNISIGLGTTDFHFYVNWRQIKDNWKPWLRHQLSFRLTDTAGGLKCAKATCVIKMRFVRQLRHLPSDVADNQVCLHFQVLFVGDSTLRGLMYALLEHVNRSLENWRQSHDMLVFQRGAYGGRYEAVEEGEAAFRPVVAFAYFPLFWLAKPSPSSLTEAVTGLFGRLNISRLTEVTLVVGGAQWITLKHLVEIDRLIRMTRASISDGNIETRSSGKRQVASGGVSWTAIHSLGPGLNTSTRMLNAPVIFIECYKPGLPIGMQHITPRRELPIWYYFGNSSLV
ncbi:unnamed protein product, partial [Schistocephalus solidus]|uniref:Exostosin domain-containing protein n=1 Tax=Schistocephalus solidus TaxID=70667 RepID=A0A183T3C7_SCHSO